MTSHSRCAFKEDSCAGLWLSHYRSSNRRGERNLSRLIPHLCRWPLVAGRKQRSCSGTSTGEGTKYAATELQKYLHALSGADIGIVSDGQSTSQSSQQTWILIGGPDQNRLVKQAVDGGLTGFSGLKSRWVRSQDLPPRQTASCCGGRE